MTNRHPQPVRGLRYWFSLVAVAIAVPVLILLLPILLVWRFAPRVVLRLWLPLRWGGGRRVLIAYTDSPIWTEYFEQRISTPLASVAVVIQRSRDPEWKSRYRAEYWALESWADHASFNPVAIVFPRFGRTRVYNFHDAFCEFKHGKSADLEAMTKQLLESAHREFVR